MPSRLTADGSGNKVGGRPGAPPNDIASMESAGARPMKSPSRDQTAASQWASKLRDQPAGASPPPNRPASALPPAKQRAAIARPATASSAQHISALRSPNASRRDPFADAVLAETQDMNDEMAAREKRNDQASSKLHAIEEEWSELQSHLKDKSARGGHHSADDALDERGASPARTPRIT